MIVDIANAVGVTKRRRFGGRSGRSGKRAAGGSLVAVIVAAILLLLGVFLERNAVVPTPGEGGAYTVIRCVDGDTLLLDDGSPKGMRVRLIGANTPETVKPDWPVEPYGPEASAFTKQVVAAGENKVRLAFDGDRVDNFGRTLALVYVRDTSGKEVMLNELLIREGLATAELGFNYSGATKNLFRQAEMEAKREKRNIWRAPASTFSTEAG